MGLQGAEHSADVVNEVQFACKQSTMLLLEFDEAVRQYQVVISALFAWEHLVWSQAARREHRSLSPEDVAKFEQFGFIVRAPDGSPIRRSPSRSPAREVLAQDTHY